MSTRRARGKRVGGSTNEKKREKARSARGNRQYRSGLFEINLDVDRELAPGENKTTDTKKKQRKEGGAKGSTKKKDWFQREKISANSRTAKKGPYLSKGNYANVGRQGVRGGKLVEQSDWPREKKKPKKKKKKKTGPGALQR